MDSSQAPMVQLLTPDGVRVEHPDFSYQGSDDDLAAALREMVLARRFDLEGTSLQRQGRLSLWPPSLGQEAAQVGAAHSLTDRDMVFPTYREHAVTLSRGVPVRDMLGLWRGTTPGNWDVSGTRVQQYTIVIGAQVLHAVGYAMGIQRDGMTGNPDPERNAAVLAFHGDGASSEGDVNESFIFAASYQAPVVFFCQNNQWAISEPTERQSRIPLFHRASGFGFPGVRVDGNDVLAVQAVTEWALERARDGQGPAFIEAFTYRMGAHTTADDPTKYRIAAETEHWRTRDPITRLTTYLRSAGAIDDAWLAALDEEAADFGASVRADAASLTEPSLLDAFDHVYAEPTVWLEEQRDGLAEWLSSFEDAEQGEAR